MAKASRTKQKLLFFKLPKELRDMVYDQLMVSRQATKKRDRDSSDLKTSITILMPKARLISRRFKLEAEEQTHKSTTLSLRDHNQCGLTAPVLPPYLLTTITHIDCSLHAWCPESRSGIPVPVQITARRMSLTITTRSRSFRAAAASQSHSYPAEHRLACGSQRSLSKLSACGETTIETR